MRIVAQEEISSLNLKGKGRSSEVYNSIINLKENEALLIEKTDWNRKASPSSLVKYIEKKHQLTLSYAALSNNNGWLVKRLVINQIDIQKPTKQPLKVSEIGNTTQVNQAAETLLTNDVFKSELTLFYLGRISTIKIEKIEDSIKAAQEHYRDESRAVIRELFEGIIKTLSSHKHIIIENDKTYIPLKKH